MKKKTLPKGWVYVEVRKLEISGYENKKPVLVDIGLKKTISLPKEQVNILNSQTHNTKLNYKIVDNAPEDAPTAAELAEANAKKLEEDKANERAALKAELLKEIEAERKK